MPGAASEAPKFGLLHRQACDDRSRTGRTGPKREDFGEHGGGGGGRIFAGAERCGARGLAHGEAGGGAAATGFWIDFGIVLNVYFIAIRTPVIDFSTKIVNEFWTGKIDDIGGTVQNYVAPADGARSGLGGAEIRIATPGSVRRPGASGVHRSGDNVKLWIDFGIVLNVYFIAIRTPAVDFSTKIVHEF